jgi:hypothetical protein
VPQDSVSKQLDRGFEYWPAIRPIGTTGFSSPSERIFACWIRSCCFALMISGRMSEKASAQSPPWIKKIWPWAANRMSKDN